MRYEDCKKQYTRHGGNWKDENEIFKVGQQMAYEWEEDFNAMRWALERMGEFLKVKESSGRENLPGDYMIGIGYKELLNRISKRSCPSLLKDEYKTVEDCPLKEGCKCCNPTNP